MRLWKKGSPHLIYQTTLTAALQRCSTCVSCWHIQRLIKLTWGPPRHWLLSSSLQGCFTASSVAWSNLPFIPLQPFSFHYSSHFFCPAVGLGRRETGVLPVAITPVDPVNMDHIYFSWGFVESSRTSMCLFMLFLLTQWWQTDCRKFSGCPKVQMRLCSPNKI